MKSAERAKERIERLLASDGYGPERTIDDLEKTIEDLKHELAAKEAAIVVLMADLESAEAETRRWKNEALRMRKKLAEGEE
jgi:predicted  nucleic acid-binding Zn-ribbon protein